MKAEITPLEAQRIVHLRRRDVVRKLLNRDKTPLMVLLSAAVVGSLVGLVGVAFEHAVNWVQNARIATLAQVADHWFIVWPLAFILSALLMVENSYGLLLPLFLKLSPDGYFNYVTYVHNNWVLLLLVAAMLEIYTTHRISGELAKEAKKL